MNTENKIIALNPQLREFLDESVKTATPVNAVASEGLLTIAAQPTAGDTLTIGTKVYLFVADGDEADDGDISVGTDLATAKAAILAAIAGSDSVNTINADITASAFATNDCTLTAIVKGISGDLIVTTETFTAAGNILDDVTLGTETAGVDGTVGIKDQITHDASYVYICRDNNSISGANWVRASVASY